MEWILRYIYIYYIIIHLYIKGKCLLMWCFRWERLCYMYICCIYTYIYITYTVYKYYIHWDGYKQTIYFSSIEKVKTIYHNVENETENA